MTVMFFNKPFKRAGDWAAGTLVIYDELSLHLPQISPGDSAAAKVQLNTHEQQAILTFAERSRTLSKARQQELADIVAEQLSLPTKDSNAHLLAIARHYAGQSHQQSS